MSDPRSTVLLVDDDHFVRVMLRDALADTGVAMLEASDGEEAIALASVEHPPVVLLDLFMPRKSGLEAIPELLRVNPGCRIVVLTSMDSQGMHELALAAGAFDFIAKPFHPIEIVSAVSRALEP